jgi:hypothetical protein
MLHLCYDGGIIKLGETMSMSARELSRLEDLHDEVIEEMNVIGEITEEIAQKAWEIAERRYYQRGA